MGHSVSHAFNSLVSPVWKASEDIVKDAFDLGIPDTPKLQEPTSEPTKNMANLPSIQGQTATGAEDSDSKRKTISRKRLGTKQLQIPLASTSTTINTSTNTGVNS